MVVFVKFPFSNSANFQAENIAKAMAKISSKFGHESEFNVYRNGVKMSTFSNADESDSFLEVTLNLNGGKGGFGSMLRALGAQISKTTNKEACRDLNGRRLRDINDEERLKKYVEKKAEREEVEKEKKEAKLAKLRRLVSGENKHEFNDPQYFKERELNEERVHEAMEQAFKLKAKDDGDPKPGPSGIGNKRKAEEDKSSKNGPAVKKGLWIGDGLTESDLEDTSSDDDDDEERDSAKVH